MSSHRVLMPCYFTMLHYQSTKTTPPPPFYLPAPNARSSECAVYCSVLVVVDVVEVNVIMGAGMHSLVSDFAVNNSNPAAVEVSIRMLWPWMRT